MTDWTALGGRALGRDRAAVHRRRTSSACAARSRSSTRSRASAPSGCGSCSTTSDYVAALGALTGGQAVQMVKAGLRRSTSPAGRSRPTPTSRRARVSRPEPLPGDSAPALVRRLNNALRRADQIEWAEGDGERARLARADRRRRRGRLRRRAQRLRADEGASSRRAPPASTSRTSSRPRRSAATWAARCSSRRRSSSARSSPRGWPPTSATCRRPLRAHRRAQRDAAHERRRRARPPVRHRRAHARGLLPRRERARLGDRPRRSPTRPTPTCSGARPRRRTSGEARDVRRRRSTSSSRASSSPTTARRRSTGSAHLDDDDDRGLPGASSRAMGYRFQFITLAGFHALNAAMFELARGYADEGMTAYVRAAGARVRARGGGLHGDAPPARGRRRLLRPRRAGRLGRRELDARAQGLDRGGAVLDERGAAR